MLSISAINFAINLANSYFSNVLIDRYEASSSFFPPADVFFLAGGLDAAVDFDLDDAAALLLCDADDKEEDVAWNMDVIACCCFFFGGGTTTAADPDSSSEEILRGAEEG